MISLNNVMTHKEAECFRALRRWQRVYLKQRLSSALFPRPKFMRQIRHANILIKLFGGLLLLILSPLLVVLWALNLIRSILSYPVMSLLTYITPRDIRGPGERNIKGLHYQFAPYIELPPELYVLCVDDWVKVLYGPEKLPEYSLSGYLNSAYLVARKISYQEGIELQRIIQSQISNAREELSNDLGHY